MKHNSQWPECVGIILRTNSDSVGTSVPNYGNRSNTFPFCKWYSSNLYSCRYRIGDSSRPDYPYSPSSLNYRQKSGIWIALILSAAAMFYGFNILFGE